MQRRIAASLVVIVGAILIGMVATTHLFGAASAFERLSDDFRPLNQDAATAQARADLTGMKNVTTEFSQKGTSVLAQALGREPSQVTSFFASQFPQTATAFLQLPTIIGGLERTSTTLDAERARFADADAIPTKSVSSWSVPLFIVIAGVLAILLGGLLITSRAATGLALLLGALMIAVPLVLSLPQKSSSADTMNENLAPIFTQATVTELNGAVVTLGNMATELQTKLVPVLADATGQPPAQVQAFLAAQFPALTTTLPGFGPALQRLQATATTIDRNLADFGATSAVSLVPIAWSIITAGIITLVSAAWAFPQPVLGARARETRATRKERRAFRRAA